MDVGQVIKAFQPVLKAFVRKRVATNEEAEDIAQDVFYKLLKTIDGATNPIQHVSAWLFKVARNTIINKGKKKKEQGLPVYQDDGSDDSMIHEFADILFLESSAPSPETEYLRSLVWTELELALSELPPEQREVFELTELEGIPIKDIAQAQGIPVNTILSRKHYAVKHLRNRLSELYDDLVYS